MTAPRNALSLTLEGTPDLPSVPLKALYRVTGRSTVELRRSILAGEPIYTAALFGNDHIEVVPRLERTVEYLLGVGLPFVVHEWVDGEREEIPLETMQAILGEADGRFA